MALIMHVMTAIENIYHRPVNSLTSLQSRGSTLSGSVLLTSNVVAFEFVLPVLLLQLLPSIAVKVVVIASHPDAHELEATLLATRLVKSLPPETTVVAHPRTKALRAQYLKTGFAPSSSKAMILVTRI